MCVGPVRVNIAMKHDAKYMNRYTNLDAISYEHAGGDKVKEKVIWRKGMLFLMTADNIYIEMPFRSVWTWWIYEAWDEQIIA